jgi:hypothetical protein
MRERLARAAGGGGLLGRDAEGEEFVQPGDAEGVDDALARAHHVDLDVALASGPQDRNKRRDHGGIEYL